MCPAASRELYANSSTGRIRCFMNQMVMHTAKGLRGSLKRIPKHKLQTDIAHVHVIQPKVQLRDSPISPNTDSEEEENQPVTSAKPPCERSQPDSPLIEKSHPKSTATISDTDLDDANSPASITKTHPTFAKPKDPRKKRPDFVFEVSLAGSNEFSLIYETDIPTLDHLIKGAFKKLGLDQEQEEITGVKVNVGDRTYNLSLDEPRDWGYISRLVVENGRRAKVAVEIA